MIGALPPRSAIALWALPAVTLLLDLLTAQGYGYFRDELYYLACGAHLDFGYVDHPPMIGLIAAVVRATLGTSLLAIRFLPAVAMAATVGLGAAIAREVGGGRFAQVLAALATMLAPIYLALSSVLSMNAFDVLAWAALGWLAARILRTGRQELWLPFGAIAGLGLENKISVLFLGFGLVLGLALARRWEVFRSRFFWLGGVLAAALFLPHLLWQLRHDWPTLEFMRNAQARKILPVSPSAFLGTQVLNAGPTALPVWLGGLAFFLLASGGRSHRALGWAYLSVLGLMLAQHAKPYYLAPAYTILFAGGGAAIEAWTAGSRARVPVRTAAAAFVVAGGILAAPLAKPLLPVETYVRYAAALGVEASSDERQRVGRLPQFFADMHGWPELAETVSSVLGRLPAEDRARACIFGQNYGEAGAIDLLGPPLGVPGAISAHNSYFLWGPRGCTGEVVVVIGDTRERLEELFRSVELGATFQCLHCMPYEDGQPIWIARDLLRPLPELWPEIKSYI